jgi:hypothetical protein
MSQEAETRPAQLVEEAIEGAVSKLAESLTNRSAFDLSQIHLVCDELVVLVVDGSRFEFHDLTKDKETTVEIIDGKVRINPWQGDYFKEDQYKRDLVEASALINEVVADLIERDDFRLEASDLR